MNQHTHAAQLAANFIASEIRRSGQNAAERMKKLKAVFDADNFIMPELTEVLDPGWLSPEQIEAERLAAEEAAQAEALAKAEAKAQRKAA